MWRSQCYSTSSDSMLNLGLLFIYFSFRSLSVSCDIFFFAKQIKLELNWNLKAAHRMLVVVWVNVMQVLMLFNLWGIFSFSYSQISKSKFRYPLTSVRPDYIPLSSRNTPLSSIPQPPPLPYSRRTPPLFMEDDNPQKYMIKGKM